MLYNMFISNGVLKNTKSDTVPSGVQT